MTHAAALLGALVADAASMGLHWLYDPQRIASVIDETGQAAFCPNRAAHFDGAKGYYAHANRRDGQFTQYGEVTYLAACVIADQGQFDVALYQQAFAAHFGAGGKYTGYIDRPTRGVLNNIAASQNDPSGIDDDQHPAIATFPALIAAKQSNLVEAMRVTNVNQAAQDYGQRFTRLLTDVLAGTPLPQTLAQSAAGNPLLEQALRSSEADSVIYGETTQRACHLPQGMPLAFHIMTHSTSYAQAVETNIRAGGDSAGRALILGSVMGAVHGIATPEGIPLHWILTMENAAQVWATVRSIT
ncbi:ADP-ribosylglycohydrolase family protein [Algirhabdus cladophorae]|uniref:ADP-ribosylglycohydrolase family protein n=1 Tax=Algirhabdus cladophorae TaxID=3377108 RepID=UPI003B845F31